MKTFKTIISVLILTIAAVHAAASDHPTSGINVLLSDGSVKFISDSVSSAHSGVNAALGDGSVRGISYSIDVVVPMAASEQP